MVAGLGTLAQPLPGSAPNSPPDQPAAPADPFTPLLAALRKTLTARKGFPIWDNSRGVNNDFHVVLVDKVRLAASQKPCDAKTGAL